MMKKLLVLTLVLSMAAAANAALIFVPSATEVHPSDNVTIAVVDTSNGVMGGIMGFAIDAIGDGAKGGTCVSQSFPAWDKTYPGTIGGDGFLDEYVSATQLSSTPLSGTTVFTFVYHVPTLPTSSYITVASFDDGGNNWFAPDVIYVGGRWDGTISTVLHVTPEPMTIGLLGIGGLFLRRRK